MVDWKQIGLLCIVLILILVPLMMFNGHGEDDGYFGGSDDAAGEAISEIDSDYTPWFESIWEPPSGEIQSLLFCVQTAIGTIIIGYIFGYWNGLRKKENK